MEAEGTIFICSSKLHLKPFLLEVCSRGTFPLWWMCFIPWLTLHRAFENSQYVLNQWPQPYKQNTARRRLAVFVSIWHYCVSQRILCQKVVPEEGVWNTQSGRGWGGRRCLWLCPKWTWLSLTNTPQNTTFLIHTLKTCICGLDAQFINEHHHFQRETNYIRDKETSYWERWLKDTVHALLICNESILNGWTKIHTGVGPFEVELFAARHKVLLITHDHSFLWQIVFHK